jgi:hypothetical protein
MDTLLLVEAILATISAIVAAAFVKSEIPSIRTAVGSRRERSAGVQ